jgi:hypothetical protein
MATTNPSLFGMLGDEAAMQRQLDEQRAQAFAQQTQEQRLASMGYSAGAGLGRGIAGAFGVDVTDPVVRQATQARQIASQYDTTTPQGLRQFAAAIKDINPDMALKASALADEQAKKIADVSKTEQEALKLTNERNLLKGRVGMLLGAGLNDNEALGIASSDTAFSNYVKAKKVETPQEYAVQGQKLGFGSKPYLSDYTPEQIKKMEEGVYGFKAGVAAAGRATTTNVQETAFSRQRGELQAKALAETEAQAKSSASSLDRLTTMESKNKGELLTGPLAGTAIGAGQFLSSLGLLSPQAAATLSSSEIYDKSAKDLVMQDLGGKLGGQVSDADRNYIEARIPQLRNSPMARAELIAKLKEIHKKNISYYKNMSSHANKYGNLNEFNFAENAPSTASPALGTKENPIKLQ